MTIDSLYVEHLRNHRQSNLDCPGGITILCGENGAGKTSLLEAVSILCSTRSFVTSQDRTLVRRGAEQLRVEGHFTSTSGSRHTVSVLYPGVTGRREVLLDHAPLERAAELIGRFPLVVLSPQHLSITTGGPGERRGFLDFAISQISHAYLLDLIEYRRILRHRNAVLSRNDLNDRTCAEHLAPWDRTMAEHAVRILRTRRHFLSEFLQYFLQALSEITEEREAPHLLYRSTANIDERDGDAIESFIGRLAERLSSDRRLGLTGIGPHRDDVLISFNGLDARNHASQGQHKSLLIALKIAEFRYMDTRLDERPVLLLDDIFSELDELRLSRIMQFIPQLGQTFITTANTSLLDHLPQTLSEATVYRIEDGSVRLYREVA